MPFELTQAQKTQFGRDGYLVIPSFFSSSQASTLLSRSHELLSSFSLENHPLTKFVGSGEAQTGKAKHVGDEYFLTSGDQVRFFFEPAAFGEDGKLNRPKEKSVNKIGHGLALLDDEFRKFTFSDDLKSLAKDLGFHQDPRVLQSMIICKNAQVGGKVSSHDDSTFLYTNPLSAMGFWFALEDCTTSNGCLSFVPGSHKINTINKRLVRVPEERGGGTEIVPIEEVESCGIDWDKDEKVEWKTAECKTGDLVLIHGSVIHRSERNLSDKSRFIYTFHCIEGSAEWDEKNWLQTPGKEFPSLLTTEASF